jgi:hypothetical protein
MVAPYHPDCPADCPPSTAEPRDGLIYRAVKKLPVVESELLSDAERNRPRIDKTNCLNWGLSVWITEDAVAYARGALAFTRKRYVVGITVTDADGRLKHTPTDNQPEHHTFWRFHQRPLAAQCQLHLEPQP